ETPRDAEHRRVQEAVLDEDDLRGHGVDMGQRFVTAPRFDHPEIESIEVLRTGDPRAVVAVGDENARIAAGLVARAASSARNAAPIQIRPSEVDGCHFVQGGNREREVTIKGYK